MAKLRMTEAQFQSQLIRKLKVLFPGCQVLKNDAHYQQGMLDLTILYEDKWAMLEPKASANSQHQPNQDHFVNHLDAMGFASFIYPENEEDVLNALQEAFKPRRRSRVSQS